MPNTIVEFDGGYGRTGTIETGAGKCDNCGDRTTCLVVDASEGEYSPGVICRACIDKLFNEHEE